MARQLLGKEVVESLTSKNMDRVASLKAKGVEPCIAFIRCGEDPSDISYEKGATKKAELLGIKTKQIILPGDVTKEVIINVIKELNEDASVHGVLMFRPLPSHLKEDQSEICNALVPEKDIDCMTDLSNAGVYEGKDIGFAPCTAQACMEMLKHYNIDLKGKHVTVIGRSLVVGKPLALMLMGANATVTVCHTKTIDVPSITKKADIIVTAAGVLGSITKEYVSEGQTVIDVSINWDPTKKDGQGGIAGDCRFEEVESIVEAITPVPGGVGAVTSLVLMDHVITAAEKR